jgi:diguanylate cyclase (GGDEF)-like protein/PAS domain S-box-containing protein
VTAERRGTGQSRREEPKGRRRLQWRGLPLRRQLLLSLVTVLVPLLVVALVASLLMRTSAWDYQEARERTDALAGIATLQSRVIQAAGALTGSVTELSPVPADRYLANSEDVGDEFRLLGESVPASAQAAVAEGAASWQQVRDQLALVADVLRNGSRTEHADVLQVAGRSADLIIVPLQALERASSATAADLSAALKRSHDRQAEQQRLLLGLVLVGGLLVATLNRLLSRRIARPLLRLQHAAERLEVGSSETVPLPGTPELAALAGAFNAMTQRLAASGRLLVQSEARFRALITHASDLVLVVQADTRVLSATPSARRILGVEADALVGRLLTDLVVTKDQPVLLAALRGGMSERSVAFSVHHADGREVATETFLVDLTTEPAVQGFVLTLRDVSERKEFEERLSHQAFHDHLTGLPNRALLRDRLSHALSRRDASPVAVLFLDLNDFKTVNDSLGHHVGDELLQLVAARLELELRAGDTASRLGGDEFVVLLEQADEQEALALAQRLQVVLAESADLGGREVFPHVAIGVAVGTATTTGADELLAHADAAMYLAKAHPAGGAQLYQPELTTDVMRRLELKTELQRALDRSELEVHYQLTVELATRRTAGAEALLRWPHPARGPISPVEFVPLAEETGLIVEIGRFVLQDACRRLVAWRDEFGPGAPESVAVNVSGRQLTHPAFVSHVREALNDSGLDPALLVLEITESVLLGDEQAILDRLNELKALGVRLAIDDFGTGYSSLAYLQRLPVDILKVDKSFVDDLTDEGSETSLVATILALAQNLQLEAVAEGIELDAQAEALRELNCEYGQGFLFERPLPPTRLHERLAELSRQSAQPVS